ncbi:MAG: FAD-dependent oxidoreductase [Nocardioides sp.]
MVDRDRDVIVVGAGVAGLRCAIRLTELGRRVRVVESGHEVGGRIGTDQIDGFLCDRGFQVFNPAYPAVRRWIDVRSLRLQRFDAGVLVRHDGGFTALANPIRSPSQIGQLLGSGLLTPRELVALGRWLAPVLAAPRRTLAGKDETLAESLDRAGVRGPLRYRVLQPFLAGVSADTSERTSAILTKLLMRMFLRGRPGLPARGMRAFPEQLAGALARLGGRLDLGRTVESVAPGPGGVRVRICGDEVIAPAVVIAADPASGCALADLPAPAMKGLTTWWFAADHAPHDAALVAVDGRRDAGNVPGPVWNASVISNAAPSYAPPGRHLIAATTLHDRPGSAADEAAVRRHVGEIYGIDPRSWELLIRHDIPRALPAAPPPLRTTRPAEAGPGIFVCGDHRDTPSIQGALVSGNRVAELLHATASSGP